MTNPLHKSNSAAAQSELPSSSSQIIVACRRTERRTAGRLAVLACCGMLASCAAFGPKVQMHHGVKYSIDPDSRSHRIEKGKDGRLMYDSPELTVVVDQGMININGQNAGPVHEGDHVEITDYGTVIVNGERRGDSYTGHLENEKRVRASRRANEEQAL